VARDPDNAAAPPRLENTARLDWRDQYVLALGVEYQWDEATALRAGYNHGRNPVPRETTNPLLAGIGERHLTFGVTRRLAAEWDLAAGIEYLLGNAVTYTNPELPFGPGAQERTSYVGVHLMVSRRW
jgi:long-chain fatty acid transport protein